MRVERTVTNLFHPNLTIFDENSILGCILADAEKLFLNVYVFVPIFSLVGLLHDFASNFSSNDGHSS